MGGKESNYGMCVGGDIQMVNFVSKPQETMKWSMKTLSIFVILYG